VLLRNACKRLRRFGTLLTTVLESRAELSTSILQAFLRTDPGIAPRACGRRCLAGNHLRTWCPPNKPAGLGSGSGESWFDPRRGNSKRDITISGVALRPFWTLFPGWSGEFCSRDRSNCRRHMMFRRLARWRPMRTTPAFKQANPGIPRRSGGMASRGRAVALAGLLVGMRRFHRRLQLG